MTLKKNLVNKTKFLNFMKCAFEKLPTKVLWVIFKQFFFFLSCPDVLIQVS